MDRYRFEPGEITINKADADKLREQIISVANSKGILTEPIHYESLLKDITDKMIELSLIYDFVYNASSVDFNKANFVMFKSKVLKSFFHEKMDFEVISLHRKNLDILSFYAYGKPWKEIIQEKNGIEHDAHLNNLTSIDLNSSDKNKNGTKKSKLIFFLMLLCLILLGVIIWLVSEIQTKKKYYIELDAKYQQIIRLYREGKFYNDTVNHKNYDNLQIPEHLSTLFYKDFNISQTLNYKNGTKIEIIKSKNPFKNEPGIKECDKFNGSYAFGFGTTYCSGDCYKNPKETLYFKESNFVIFRIKFIDTIYISYLSFKWVEIGNNWGSYGHAYVNKKQIGNDPYQYIGIYPNSNLLKDESTFSYKCKVDKTAKYIDIAVIDIADGSEIFINDIIVLGK